MSQPGDVTVIATLSIQNSANAAIVRAGEACDGWINTASHTTRDALPTAVTTLGTLIRTLNDGIVWEVTSVGPVVYAAWSGSGGVTSFATRTGAVVPATNDYTDLQVQNTSSVTGTGVKGALNTLLASIGGLVTGVSTVFGRANHVIAVVGDYAASFITNDSATVSGAHVSDALDALNVGGVHSVANNAALTTYPSAMRQEGMLLYSEQTQCYFELQHDLTTWVFFDANPALASQANWYVDQSGSNDNDGTLSHPLLDLTELSRRLCPRGKKCFLTNDIRVDVNSITLNPATSYGELILNVDTNETLSGLAVYTVNVVSAVTSSAPITLHTVVLPSGSSSIRGELTTLSGTFVYQERIRITSGTAAGAVCYSTGLNGSAQDTFVSVLSTPTIASILLNSGHGPTSTVPAPGDTCVVDTLTVSINRVIVTCGAFAQVFVQDAKIIGLHVDGYTRSIFAGSGGNLYLSGCIQSSAGGAWICDASGAFLLSCRTPSADSTTLIGAGWCIVEHALQGRIALDGHLISYGITLDGGHIVVGQGTDFNHPGQSRPSMWQVNTSFANGATGGGIEAENGASGSFTTWPAVIVSPGSTLQVNDFNTYLWGASSAYGIGLEVFAHAYIVQGTVTDGRIAAIYKIPSVINIILANLQFAYSDNTIHLTNSDCGLISFTDVNQGNNLNQADNGLRLTAQSGNQGPFVFPGMTKAGLYDVWGYVATTTLDAAAVGNPILNVIFTDDSGVQRIVPVAASPSLTALGGNGGLVPIESAAGGAISWSVTGIGSAGSSKYSIRMRISVRSIGP